jgi:hypothetical protein
MTNRHRRRADLANFKRNAPGALLTYLVPPNDGALSRAPLLKAAADHWLDALRSRARHCIVCSSWLVDRRHVGALLLTTAATTNPTSASTAAVCRECWEADLPIEALERACATVLHEVIPGGRFAPPEVPRTTRPTSAQPAPPVR